MTSSTTTTTTTAKMKTTIFKQRADYVVFGSLVLTLVIIVFLRLESFSSDNATILENQRLIKESLNASQTNTELIIQNQEQAQHAIQQNNEIYLKLINLAQTIDDNTDSNRNMTIQNRAMITALSNSFTKGFAQNVTTRQLQTLSTSNETLINTDKIIELLKRNTPIRSGPT